VKSFTIFLKLSTGKVTPVSLSPGDKPDLLLIGL
jgi:hypothetical protein